MFHDTWLPEAFDEIPPAAHPSLSDAEHDLRGREGGAARVPYRPRHGARLRGGGNGMQADPQRERWSRTVTRAKSMPISALRAATRDSIE